MIEVKNKTMDIEDFMLPAGMLMIKQIDDLIRNFQDQGLALSAWNGKLTTEEAHPDSDSRNCGAPGGYTPLPDAADDGHFPWFLYWEIYWTLQHTPLKDGSAILDAGGSCSLFWAYLCNLRKHRVFSCELSSKLVGQATIIAWKKDWNEDLNSFSLATTDDVTKLAKYSSETMDAIFSICVMEHLTIHQRRRSIQQFYRILKPGGTLTITFDYKNPRVAIYRLDPEDPFIPKEQLISTPEDLRSSFLHDEGLFEILYNQEFYDNGKTYLGHKKSNYAPYTFGALFLRKR